jgi:hypothetical protein
MPMPPSAAGLPARFVQAAQDILGSLAQDLGAVLEPIDSLKLGLRSSSTTAVLELSKGHAWQLSVIAAPNNLPPSEPVALGFVLQALTEGVETYSPRWITREAELAVELERLAARFVTHGRAIFGGEVDWRRAREFCRAGVAQAVAAASGRSRLAGTLESAEAAFGRDDWSKARELYERIEDRLGPVERARLAWLRRV